MIDFYAWSAPNGRMIYRILKEAGLSYRSCLVDIGKGQQFKPDFVKISPDNHTPAIVDCDTETQLFNSGVLTN